ncbi:10008_t:CDS:10 [Ambispora leptoticha]|uniref:Glutamine synthetase n=1 Tax=Ambispora leptoticha TaxID=144679 RepID=A0A9N8VFU3_9GLOM|nr:10008_t:CDS:10 [Ambispora leptoticha]
MATERTYIMVKPDGVERGLVGEIIKRFENKGYQLLALQMIKPTKELLEEHYTDLKEKPFFPGLIKYMSAGPVVGMVWIGKDIVKVGRRLLGETNPLASNPGTIRGDFGIDVGRNLCHGSDSPDNAEREISLWFPNGVVQWDPTENNMTQKDLVEVVATFAIIDGHAHPLLTNQNWHTYPIEAAFTEATNPALQDSTHTLSLKRGIKKLTQLSSKLYGPEISSPSSQLESLKTQRAQHSFEECCETCFKAPNVNIQCILFDDGLYGDFQSLESHAGLVDQVRRVVRIERVAEEILENLSLGREEDIDLSRFGSLLREKLIELAKDDNVVAFKSIAAYRTGLNINAHKEENPKIEDALIEILQKSRSNKSQLQPVRIDEKVVIDFIVNIGIKIASDFKKPIQFHTGFGDNDLDLIYSNPLHLRALIEKNPDAKIVLLHASYPYTRQAGYLASVYNNVFVDIGMIFPQISRYAQLQTLHEIISLTPTNKILFSTDGHHVPEVFYCAVVDARDTLTKVLIETIENGDLSNEEAIEIAKKILFFNANSVYNLSLTPKSLETTLPISDAEVNPIQAIRKFRANGAKFVRVDWLDISNIHRHHVIPIERFEKHTINSGVSVAKVVQCLPYCNDAIIPNSLNATGEILLKPDLKTLKQTAFPAQIRAHSFMVEKITGRPFELCPRLLLKKIVDDAYKEFGVKFLIGFESEFCVINTSEDGSFKPIEDSVYAASSAMRCPLWISSALEEIAESLLEQDIEVEQYEMVTGPAPPLESIDNLVSTRQTIYDIIAKYGHQATFLPKPFPDQAGNGSHLHLSLTTENKDSSNNDRLSKYEQSFIAGTLRHLRALCALTLPTPNSYHRIVNGCWAGSTYVCYGYENRETQIRICYRGGSYNFEHRFLDATANPYIAAAALIAAGITGMREGLDLSKNKPIEVDPATLSDQERHAYGITDRIPLSLRESLNAFKKDEVLQDVLGKEFSRIYLTVKEGELAFAENLNSQELIKVLISRY